MPQKKEEAELLVTLNWQMSYWLQQSTAAKWPRED